MALGNASIKNYRPLGMSIIVEVYEVDRSEYGIILGTTKKDKWLKVVKASEGLEKEFSPGDYVIVPPNSGFELEFDDEEKKYFQINSHSVMGLVKKEDAEEVERRTLQTFGKSKIIA